MSCDQEMMALLAGSAAGALEPEEERRLRDHVRTCAACAGRLREFSDLARTFSGLPAPQASPEMIKRTQFLLAAELAARADRRQAAVMAGVTGVCAWVVAFCIIYASELWNGGGIWVWLAWWVVPPMFAAPAAAAIQRLRTRKSIAW